ncbi:MAG: class A beta-lactamase-related serine hydrolase [Atopobiaceae bacterium]|nr:class A beta-lactamase-related serine hydrolase [Atopobiaceae bacterium]MCH4181519.1 class A beta-lactamase-related serine hydrolase [Atopobiaceae bacterium]MCH4214658.1 class A beta-lactamase-related serine hydrolase [Atopobiaceae bacterium]MCH4275747.1 class A beta-lactamase-related serine hydrolase [Atopobiaceae bacterium]MCI1225889.1 class A beta-lactamase-related serine hydrolase [Atopobiaceae bacterium]
MHRTTAGKLVAVLIGCAFATALTGCAFKTDGTTAATTSAATTDQAEEAISPETEPASVDATTATTDATTDQATTAATTSDAGTYTVTGDSSLVPADLTRILASSTSTEVSVAYIELDRDTVSSTAAASAGTSAATTSDTTQTSARYSVNGDKRLVSASMIKLVILETVFQQADAGTISLDDEITIHAADIVGGSGIIQNMGGDVTLTVEELCNFMISSSDNDAANALIDLVGMDSVNSEASRLGLASTSLQRKMMDTAAVEQGRQNYTSANDIATLLESIAKGTFVNEAYSKKAEQYLLLQQDTTGLRAGIPNNVTVASKTGDLDRVYNAGGIVYTSKPYIVVAMVNDMAVDQARSLVSNIATATYASHEAHS